MTSLTPKSSPESQFNSIAPQIRSALDAIRQYNKAFSAEGSGIDAVIQELRGNEINAVSDESASAEETERRFLQTYNLILNRAGLAITPLVHGGDVQVGGPTGSARFKNRVALLTIHDPHVFAVFSNATRQHDSALLRDMHTTFFEQITKYGPVIDWQVYPIAIENIAPIPPVLHQLGQNLLSVAQSGAIRAGDLKPDEAEIMEHMSSGTLKEFLMFDEYVVKAKNGLIRVPNASVGRPEFWWLESDWQQALEVFKQIASNSRTAELAQRTYELLSEYIDALTVFLSKQYPNAWKYHFENDRTANLEDDSLGLLVFLKGNYAEFGTSLDRIKNEAGV